MIWGVGAGRCGTKSLAKQLGGLHEPSPKLCVDPLAEAATIEILKYRLSLAEERAGTIEQHGFAIVDFKHSFVIHLIREIDPDARFAWVVRNPFDNIISYLAGNPEMTLEAAIQRWLTCNQKCIRLPQSVTQLYFCNELTEHMNQHMSSPTYRIDREAAKQIADRCYGLWNEILSMR